jgi:hypothetical protein
MNRATSGVSEVSGFIEEDYLQVVGSMGIDVCHEDFQKFTEAIEVEVGKRREDRECQWRRISSCLVIETGIYARDDRVILDKMDNLKMRGKQ